MRSVFTAVMLLVGACALLATGCEPDKTTAATEDPPEPRYTGPADRARITALVEGPIRDERYDEALAELSKGLRFHVDDWDRLCAVLILNRYRDRDNYDGPGVDQMWPRPPGPNPSRVADWLVREGPNNPIVLFELLAWYSEDSLSIDQPDWTRITDFLLTEIPGGSAQSPIVQRDVVTYRLPKAWAETRAELFHRLQASHPGSPEAKFARAVALDDAKTAYLLLGDVESTTDSELYWRYDLLASMALRARRLGNEDAQKRVVAGLSHLGVVGPVNRTLYRLSGIDKVVHVAPTQPSSP